MVGVFPFEERGHGAVFGCGEHDLCAQQHPRQQRTEQGNDQANADQHCPPMPDDVFKHGGHGRVLQFGQLGLGHDAQRQHVHQYQKQQHGDEADDGGLAHVRAFLGTGGEDACAFDADEHPDGDQHHVADLIQHTAQIRVFKAPNISSEDVQLEREEGDQHEQQ